MSLMHTVFDSASFTSYGETSSSHIQTSRFSQLYVIFRWSWWKAHRNNVKFQLIVHFFHIYIVFFKSWQEKYTQFCDDSGFWDIMPYSQAWNQLQAGSKQSCVCTRSRISVCIESFYRDRYEFKMGQNLNDFCKEWE